LLVVIVLAGIKEIPRQAPCAVYHPAMSRASTRLAPSHTPVPLRWRGEVERILITDAMLARRIRTLAAEIQRD